MNLRAYIPVFLTVLFLTTSPAAQAQFPPQLKNLIIVVQENRTPDNLFHYLTPACPIPPKRAGAYRLHAGAGHHELLQHRALRSIESERHARARAAETRAFIRQRRAWTFAL